MDSVACLVHTDDCDDGKDPLNSVYQQRRIQLPLVAASRESTDSYRNEIEGMSQIFAYILQNTNKSALSIHQFQPNEPTHMKLCGSWIRALSRREGNYLQRSEAQRSSLH